jgi:hypothetical protein
MADCLDEACSALEVRSLFERLRAKARFKQIWNQPEDCMQAFDELLLLKRGGRVIYNGPTGRLPSNAECRLRKEDAKCKVLIYDVL